MKKTNLVQGNRYIVFELHDDTVVSRWGKIDGKEQTTSHTYGYINQGKANELGPPAAAFADYERKVEKKVREGYTKVTEIKEIISDNVAFDFDCPQSSFTLSKPVTKISDKKLFQMISKGESLLQEKENGMCHWVVFDSEGEVRVFTRRMHDHTRKYPGVVEAFKKTRRLEGLVNSVFAVEFTVDCDDHHRGFRLMQEISKSDTLRGELKEDQSRSYELQEYSPVRGCVFAVLFLDGDEMWKRNYTEHWSVIDYVFRDKTDGVTLYKPVTLNCNSVMDVKNYIKCNEKRLEGLVCWDKYGTVEVTFDGKPKRRAAYKVKVPKETDVVAYDWVEGTGDHQGNIGALKIGKYRDGVFLDYGKVGSGITDEMMNPDLWEFPCVIEIEYEYHEPTGKFKFPRFSKIHEDKLPEECVAEEDEASEAKPVWKEKPDV